MWLFHRDGRDQSKMVLWSSPPVRVWRIILADVGVCYSLYEGPFGTVRPSVQVRREFSDRSWSAGYSNISMVGGWLWPGLRLAASRVSLF